MQMPKSIDSNTDNKSAQSSISCNTSFDSMNLISFIATMDLPESDCDASVDSWKNIQAFKS